MSKNSWVIRKSTPAATFSARCSRSASGLTRMDVGLREAGGADRKGVVRRRSARRVRASTRGRPRSWSTPPVRPAGRRAGRARCRSRPARISSSVSRSSRTVAPDAGEVGHRLEAVLVPDPLDDLDRLLARGAARAVGDRHERGLQRPQLGERRVQVLLAGLGLRREELEREHRARRAARISSMRIVERMVPACKVRRSGLRASRGAMRVQRSGSPAMRCARPWSEVESIASVCDSSQGRSAGKRLLAVDARHDLERGRLAPSRSRRGRSPGARRRARGCRRCGRARR